MTNRFSHITQGLKSQRAEHDAPPADIIPGDETTLSESEAQALHYYERVIERGLKTFLEVGMALARVRDLRLYRAEYPTFEAYSDVRWGLKRQRAYELMNAASVVRHLSEISDIPTPARESHAAALARLKDPEQQRAAWQRALSTANGPLTAAHIEAVVRELLGQHAPVAPAEVFSTGEQIQEVLTQDSPGAVSCDNLSPHEAEALRTRIAELEHTLATARSIIEEYQEHITRAQQYNPTSDRGEVVSLLIAALERVWGVLREAMRQDRAEKLR